MNEAIRYGFVGVGGIARGAHIRTVQALSLGPITAVCDTKPEALEEGRRMTGAAFATPDYRVLVNRADVDAVVVCTPNDTHADIAVAALQAGKHVLCEKPMATTARDCDRMTHAARTSGRVLQIAQPYRYAPFYRKMRKLIDDGAVGKVQMAWAKECMQWGDVAPSEQAWRMYQKRTGGILVEKNCHHLDLLNWMIGSEPVRVAAFGGKAFYQKPEIMDHVTLICEYANGAKGTLLLVLYQSKGLIDLEVGAAGPLGRIETFDQNEMYLYQRTDEATRQVLERAGWSSGEIDEIWPEIKKEALWASPKLLALSPQRREDAYAAAEVFYKNLLPKRPENIAVPSEDHFMHPGVRDLHRDFAACVREGRAPFCDAGVGKASVLIGLAGEIAARENRIVEIAEIERGT
jgi:predicted dehydrogenase